VKYAIRTAETAINKGLNRRMHLYTFFDFDGHRIADNIEHKYQPKYLYKAESKRSQTLRFSSAPARPVGHQFFFLINPIGGIY
jgi:hypothetical protein